MLNSKLKPLAKAERSPVLIRRTGVQVTRDFEEALFREADVLSEGSMRPLTPGHATYFGSTMIRIRIAALLARARAFSDGAERAALFLAIEGSVRASSIATMPSRRNDLPGKPNPSYGSPDNPSCRKPGTISNGKLPRCQC